MYEMSLFVVWLSVAERYHNFWNVRAKFIILEWNG